MTTDLRRSAIAILRDNDRGQYTVPTEGLYPFQCDWDSCFTALGQSHYDLDRTWTEVETLFAHQWNDVMVHPRGGDALVLADCIHPNAAGHVLFADAFAAAALIE